MNESDFLQTVCIGVKKAQRSKGVMIVLFGESSKVVIAASLDSEIDADVVSKLRNVATNIELAKAKTVSTAPGL